MRAGERDGSWRIVGGTVEALVLSIVLWVEQ